MLMAIPCFSSIPVNGKLVNWLPRSALKISDFPFLGKASFTASMQKDAMAESFFSTLEAELLSRRRFAFQAEARMACFSTIDG